MTRFENRNRALLLLFASERTRPAALARKSLLGKVHATQEVGITGIGPQGVKLGFHFQPDESPVTVGVSPFQRMETLFSFAKARVDDSKEIGPNITALRPPLKLPKDLFGTPPVSSHGIGMPQ